MRDTRGRDGSLISFGEGVEDIHIYLMEFGPPSQINIKSLVSTPALQMKQHTHLKLLLIFHPLSL